MARPTALELDALIDAVDAREPADVLAGITAAEAVAAELARLGERLVGFYVERARTDGRSWADIGEQVGITRQAAQQRFGDRWSALTVSDLDRAGAFSRLTARARTALLRSEDRARRLGQEAIGVEHVLLAVLDDRDALAATAMATMGIDVDALERALAGRLPHAGATGDHAVRVGAPARRLVSRAVVEAVGLGHNYVGTEHLLLAALDDAGLTEVLAGHGLERERTRATVVDLLDAYLRRRE